MKTLKKAAIVAGKVVGLVFGREFPTPRDLLRRSYPCLAFSW